MAKRRIEPGSVRQGFSHGRTKPLVVEKAKGRSMPPTTARSAADCPSCGARMKKVGVIPKLRAGPKRVMWCPACGKVTIKDDE